MRIHRLLALLILILLGTATKQKIQKTSDLEDISIIKSGILDFDLSKNIDFSEAKYPISITTTKGQGFTFQNSFQQISLTSLIPGQIQLFKLLDKNLWAIFSLKNEVNYVSFCKMRTNRCETLPLNFDSAERKNDFRCEDLILNPWDGSIIAACRAPKTESQTSIISVFRFDLDSEGKFEENYKIEFEEEEKFFIKNRINLKIYKDPETDEVILMHDSFLNNNPSDQEIIEFVRPFRILGDAFDKEEPYPINDPGSSLKSILDFSLFQNKILSLSGKKNSQDSKLCFTLLKFDSDEKELVVTNKFQCLDVDEKSFGKITESGNLSTFNFEEKTGFLQKVDMNFEADVWITDLISFQDFTNFEIKGGVFDVVESDNGIIFKFLTGNFFEDHERQNLLSVSDLKIQKEIHFGVIFDDFFAEIIQDNIEVKLLRNPFLKLNLDTDAEFGDNEIQMKISDSDQSVVNLKFNVQVIKDIFSQIEYQPHPSNLKIYEQGLIFHELNDSDFSKGNLVSEKILQNSEQKNNMKISTSIEKELTHSVTLSSKFPEGSHITWFKIKTGALLFLDQNSNQVYWYECQESARLETMCYFQKNTKNLESEKMAEKIGVVLQVAYTSKYNEEENISYFNWLKFGEDWEYQIYEGKIWDIGHFRREKGQVFTALAFDDFVKISLFFDDWIYGNRNSVDFYHYNLGAFEFCPRKVIEDVSDRSSIYILSVCNDQTELYKFEIQENDDNEVSVVFVNSRFLNVELSDLNLCILKDEILAFSKEEKRIFSLSKRQRDLRKIELKAENYKINDGFNDFICRPEQNEFIILSKNLDAYVFNGGKIFNGFKRLQMKAESLGEKYPLIESFTQNGDTVLLNFNPETFEMKARRILKDRYFAYSTYQKLDGVQSINAVMEFTTPSSKSAQFQGPKISVVKIVLPGIKVKKKEQFSMEKRIYKISDLLETQGVVLDMRVSGGGGRSKTKAYCYKRSDEKIILEEKTIGSIQVFKEKMIIGAFSKSTHLNYGYIALRKNQKIVSEIYSYESFKNIFSAETSQGSILTLVLTFNEFKSDLLAIYSMEDKFVGSFKEISSDSNYDVVEVYTTIEDKEDHRFGFLAILLDKKNGNLKFMKILVIENEGDWEIIAGNFGEIEDKIDSFNIVNKDQETFSVYYILKDSRKVERIEIDKKYFEVKNQGKIQFEDEGDIRIQSMSCELTSELVEKCAFTTFGGILYYVEYKKTEGPKKKIKMLDSGKRRLSEVKYEVFRLMKYDFFNGKHLVIKGGYIIHVNDNFDFLSTFLKKKVLIWEIEKVKNEQKTKKVEYSPVSMSVTMDISPAESSDYSNFLGAFENTDGKVVMYYSVFDKENNQNIVASASLEGWTVEFVDGASYSDVQFDSIQFFQMESGGQLFKVNKLFDE